MTPTKLLIGTVFSVLAIAVGGVWFATEWAAWHLGFQPQLGAPWFYLFDYPVYPVWAFFVWWYAYDAYTTDHGAIALNQYAQANDPFKAIGQHTVSVQVNSVVRVSDNSFQVKWTEQLFDHDALSKTERWTSILSVVTKPPATAEILKRNPLGLYINALNWSRELDN